MTAHEASPRSLAEALAALERQPAVRPIAGCTDLMVADPPTRHGAGPVLDLLRIPELRGIAELPDGGVEIGATTTFSELRQARVIRERYPILAEAAAVVGGWQIQNRATLGGNVVNASPAGDSLPVLLALGATAVAIGPCGRREIPYDAFHVGYRETALSSGELLGWLRLPPPLPGMVQRFRKVGTRQAQAISKVVVALALEPADGCIRQLRLAAGSVAAIPVRLAAAESLAAGRRLDAATADAVAAAAAAEIEPIDDVRSTAEYRRFVLGRVVRRMLLDVAG